VVLWLREYDIDIGCIEVSARSVPGAHQAVITARQLIPLPEAEDYLVRRRRREQEEDDTTSYLDSIGPWFSLWLKGSAARFGEGLFRVALVTVLIATLVLDARRRWRIVSANPTACRRRP
jgi:hypothetical protein